MTTNYEKDRSGYKFSNTGEVRLIGARHAIQLAKDNLLDLSTVSFDFKSNEMKINEQLKNAQDVMDEIKDEKERRIEEAKRIERQKKEALIKLEKDTVEAFNKNIEQLRKNDMYEESTFSKIVNNLRRDKNNAVAFKDESKLVFSDKSSRFIYQKGNMKIERIADYEEDTYKIFPNSMSEKEKEDEGKKWLAENEIKRKHDKMFKNEARKLMFKEIEGQKFSTLIDPKNQEALSKGKGFKGQNPNHQYLFRDGDMVFMVDKLTLKIGGKDVTKSNVFFIEKYDKKGFVMNDNLKKIKEKAIEELKEEKNTEAKGEK